MKLPIDDTFELQVLNQANVELEEERQRGLSSKFPQLVPPDPVRLCFTEIHAVLTALHVLGYYTPPLWRDTEVQP